jgi:hypothetical protein
MRFVAAKLEGLVSLLHRSNKTLRPIQFTIAVSLLPSYTLLVRVSWSSTWLDHSNENVETLLVEDLVDMTL